MTRGVVSVNIAKMQSKNGVTQIAGQVLESLPNTTFKVLLSDGREIMAHLAGKLRLYRIRVLPGDKVQVEMSPYDQNKGRIIYRGK